MWLGGRGENGFYVVAWGALATKVGAVRRKEIDRERSMIEIILTDSLGRFEKLGSCVESPT